MGSTATTLQMRFVDYCDCFYSLFHVIADGGRMTQKTFAMVYYITSLKLRSFLALATKIQMNKEKMAEKITECGGTDKLQ